MNELMFTGLQMVGCAVMCLAAGIGIGAVGLRLLDRIMQQRTNGEGPWVVIRFRIGRAQLGKSGVKENKGDKKMKYIRLNAVDAEPMKFGEFKEKFPKSGGANVERGAEDEGYVITYRKGEPNEYVSWCPKAEFEAVSRPVDGMTFGEAIELMKRGKKVARAGWNGKGMWLSVPLNDGPKEISATGIWGKPNAEYAEQNGGTVKVLPYVTMKTADGCIVMGWLASQTDMLAEDWQIVE